MKKFLSLLFVSLFLFCGCSAKPQNNPSQLETNVSTEPETETVSTEAETLTVQSSEITYFSFEDVKNVYPEGDPGVITEGFVNTEKTVCENEEQAIALAKKECTVYYNVISVAFDPKMNIYSVSFWMMDVLGGDQTVYIDQYGVTKLIVYGE